MWVNWMTIVFKNCPAFKRIRTFQWFVTILAGITVREDMDGGVSSNSPYLYSKKLVTAAI